MGSLALCQTDVKGSGGVRALCRQTRKGGLTDVCFMEVSVPRNVWRGCLVLRVSVPCVVHVPLDMEHQHLCLFHEGANLGLHRTA